MKKLIVLILVALALLVLAPAAASAATPTLQSLAKTVTALQQQVATQKAQIKTLTTKLTKAQAVLALAPYVSLDKKAINGVTGPNIVFSGVNVQVRSSQSEGDISGLGNLIVGWDTPPVTVLRSGSNNLVVGEANNFTSFGGFIAGNGNAISGLDASVSGGYENLASGEYASVSGGASSTAAGTAASVSGGSTNSAQGDLSSVGGGYSNTAKSRGASVSGGTGIALNSTSDWAWAGGAYHTP